MTRWTSRCIVAIILRMFHVLYFMTVFWWLRWCVTLLLMYTSYGLNAVCFGSLSWKIVPIFLKRRKGGMWQIGPNLSSGIRWCLTLASVRPQWCLLWRFWSIYSGHYTTSVNCCNRTFYCNDNKITEFDMINTKNSSTAYVVIYKIDYIMLLDWNRRMGI